MPYYIKHLIVALLISIVVVSPIAGGMFYVGREVRDYEKLGFFDHKGFWWPVIPTLTLDIMFKVFILSIIL